MTEPCEAFTKLAEGDASDAVFDAAVPFLGRLIRGYLTWLGARGEKLEDLAQEALVRVYLNRGRRRGTSVGSMRRWIQTLCRNLLVDHSRQEPIDRRRDPAAETAPAPDLEMSHAMAFCLADLPEPEGTVFQLRYLHEWSTRQIADVFGWKPRNCELVLARARARLAHCLKRQGCNPGGQSRTQGEKWTSTG